MKLVYCLECNDMVRLTKDERTCECGRSGGQYEPDGLNATFFGENSVPVGFTNSSFRAAIRNRPHSGMGYNFTAFVMPTVIPTLKYKCR